MSDPQLTQQYQPPNLIEETIQRHHYEERLAWGGVDGTTVWMRAGVDGAQPTLTVVAGGDVHEGDSDADGAAIGGYTHQAAFEYVEILDQRFNQFVDAYGVEEHDVSEFDEQE